MISDQLQSPWIGHLDQLLLVRRFQLLQGRSAGLECIDVQSGSGLSFCVVLDRAMSIQAARYCGTNLAYLPPAGASGAGSVWQMEEYFEGGLMFTCGLDSTGPPNGSYRRHGMLRRMPAEDVVVRRLSKNGVPGVEISGTVIQGGNAFGDVLILKRTITCWNNQPRILICDHVRNVSCQKAGLMLMYHFNLGWPLLSQKAELHIPSIRTKARDALSERALTAWEQMEPPQADWKPQVFYHDLDTEKDEAAMVLDNPDAGVGIRIRVNPQQLPFVNQWRSFSAGQYTLGVEPCNCYPIGRSRAEQEGLLDWLWPGEERLFQLSFEVSNLTGR